MEEDGMAWIESHQELKDHPKTRKLARQLGITVPAAIGHLHCLWWWALEYAQDGDLSVYDAEDIADAAMWEGESSAFTDGLIKAGFIDSADDTDAITIHDWMEYAGRLVTSRRRKADAMKLKRDGTLPAQGRNVTGTLPVRAVTNRNNTVTVPYTSSSNEDEDATPSAKHDYPDWFQPLIDLKGFKATAHKNATQSIREGCEEAGVNEAEVVSDFAEYYRDGGRATNGWSDPVAALVRTLPVQIAKGRKSSNRPPPKVFSVNSQDFAAMKAAHDARQERG
jgi:hypothetical protein